MKVVREVPESGDPRPLDSLSLERLLLYGADPTRHDVAARLLAQDDRSLWQLLADTARSDEPWQLRARCLEVLGVMAGNTDRDRAVRILDALFGSQPGADGI